MDTLKKELLKSKVESIHSKGQTIVPIHCCVILLCLKFFQTEIWNLKLKKQTTQWYCDINY